MTDYAEHSDGSATFTATQSDACKDTLRLHLTVKTYSSVD